MNPHNLILFLRNRHPWGARLLDGIKGLGLSGSILEVKIDTSRWPGSELAGRADEFREIAEKFLERALELNLLHSPADPELLPFPINSTKYWNHVGFLHLGEDGGVGLWGARKTTLPTLLQTGGAPSGEEAGVFSFSRGGGGGNALASHLDALPDLLDLMAATGRAQASYVQLVTPFPGHARSEELEGRYCSIKEWGTPRTPPAILQKYTGRIHYLTPETTHRGFSLARRAVEGGE